MTDIDVIEQRVRRAMRAVADQPVPPAGVDSDLGPRPHSGSPRRSGRLVAGIAATVVLLAGFGALVAYGPRSSTPSVPASSAVWGVYSPVTPASTRDLHRAAATVTARLRALGAGDATVSVTDGRLEVRGTAVTPTDLQAAGATGMLLFRPAECLAAPYAPATGATPTTGTPVPSCGAYQLTRTALGAPPQIGPADPQFADIPSTAPALDDPTSTVVLPGASGGGQGSRYVLAPAVLDGSAVAGATASREGADWVVDLSLTSEGAAQWDTIAQRNFHMIIAVDLDGQVLSAPVIEPSASSFSSFDGQVVVSGNFTAAQAQDVAVLLDHGALTVPLVLGSGAGASPPGTF
jgi:hypothetical protein